MAEQQVTAPVVERNEIVDRARGFWAQFSKPIIYIGSALILLGGGWLAYKYLVLAPKEEKAADLLFPAEQLFGKMAQTGFNKDSATIVLNGGQGVTNGVVKIASNYGGTAAGNRAKFIAGACYLHTGDFTKAVKYLEDFSTKATQVQSAAYTMLGDANAELKKNDAALSMYKKAAGLNTKDEFMTTEALYRAASFADATGNTKEAVDLYKKIRDEYPRNAHSADIEKYLARLGVYE